MYMRKINEIGVGSFRPGREPQGKHNKSIDQLGPTSNADSVISQRMQYNVGNYDYDEDISYKELGDQSDDIELSDDNVEVLNQLNSKLSQLHSQDFDDIESMSDDEEVILECRVYRNGKYCLIETLDNLNESYADRFASMMGKISRQSKKRTDDIDTLPDAKDVVAKGIKKEDNKIDDDNPLEEFSGAAAGGGGPAVPIGYTAKGKPETPSQRRKRQRFNITKSYPYTKLANPPRKRRN